MPRADGGGGEEGRREGAGGKVDAKRNGRKAKREVQSKSRERWKAGIEEGGRSRSKKTEKGQERMGKI